MISFSRLVILAVLLAPFAIAADITPEDTPCQSYTTLYYEGDTLKISEFCLLRTCLAENRSAQFYFKYSKANKQKMTVTLKDYASGLLEWSNGATVSVGLNDTKRVDLDKNGFYDQRVWHEFDKPDIEQACFKIYEIKESSAYKVPSPNDLALLAAPQAKNTTQNTTAPAQSESSSGSSQAVPAQTHQSETPLSESSGEAGIESTTEIVEGTIDESASSSPQSRTKMVIGVTISVIVIAVILAVFFLYERRKRRREFSLHINEEIGKVDLGKKE